MSVDWISVKESMPDNGTICAVYGKEKNIEKYDLAIKGKAATWEFGSMEAFPVTHWMPLLEPPAGTAEGGHPMTPKRLSALLVLALAAIALTVCAGLAAGVSMWPWIVAYWAVLTIKNIVDWIGREKE